MQLILKHGFLDKKLIVLLIFLPCVGYLPRESCSETFAYYGADCLPIRWSWLSVFSFCLYPLFVFLKAFFSVQQLIRMKLKLTKIQRKHIHTLLSQWRAMDWLLLWWAQFSEYDTLYFISMAVCFSVCVCVCLCPCVYYTLNAVISRSSSPGRAAISDPPPSSLR